MLRLGSTTAALQERFAPDTVSNGGLESTVASMSVPAADGDELLVGLKDRERRLLLRVLKKTGWKIYGVDGAAALLKLKHTTLALRIKKLGLRKPA